MISTILANAWRVYREQFRVIAALVVVVWLPCELLSSYLDAFVFDPDDFRRSFKFAQLLDNFPGIIAAAGVTFIALTARSGESSTFGSAIGAGLNAWWRTWWTRFLSTLAIVLGFLLLILPGIYLLTRLCFVQSVAVVERVSGGEAIRRSFELTHDRFWQTFRLGVILFLLLIVPGAVVILPTVFIPALDHWLIDAASQLAGDIIGSFSSVALYCGYEAYSDEPSSASSPDQRIRQHV
jgi:hypothetical protein